MTNKILFHIKADLLNLGFGFNSHKIELGLKLNQNRKKSEISLPASVFFIPTMQIK